jgi:uncharacterized membrane protein
MFSYANESILASSFLSTAVNLDPLEQFDVLAFPLPFFSVGLTNLSLLLGLNILVMGA